MPLQVNSADPALRRPGLLLREAWGDSGPSLWLGWRLFTRGTAARIRENALGLLWLPIPAIAMTATFVYLAEVRVTDFDTGEAPYLVFVLTGISLWLAFLEALAGPLGKLLQARSSLRFSSTPFEPFVVAAALDVLLNFAVRLVLIAIVMAIAGVPPGPELLLAPIGLLSIVLLGLAIGVLLAPLGMLYGDIQRALALAGGFTLFLTPIVFPTPDTLLIELNPLTPAIVNTREMLLGQGGDVLAVSCLAAGSAALLALALLVLRISRPHVIGRL